LKEKDLRRFKLVKDLRNAALVSPNEWFTMDVIAQGEHIIIKVNDKTTVDTMERGRRLTAGHFALQDHTGLVYFRKIEVKELEDSPRPNMEKPGESTKPAGNAAALKVPAPQPKDDRAITKSNLPRAPRLIPVFRVVLPGDVLLTTNEREVNDLKKRYPGKFQGDRGHLSEVLGYAFAQQQPGAVLLRRYWTGRKHVYTTWTLNNPSCKEEFLAAWVPVQETFGASVRLGFVRGQGAAMDYGPEGLTDAFRKNGYHPSGLRFYLFDQGGP
jgi:hypothetical protein